MSFIFLVIIMKYNKNYNKKDISGKAVGGCLSASNQNRIDSYKAKLVRRL